MSLSDFVLSFRIRLRLVERRRLAPGVLHLGFEHAAGAPLPFKPGQFVQLFFRDAQGQEQRRSFSLACPPRESGGSGRWELAVSLLPTGLASQVFQTLPLGALLEGAGPFGRFHLLPDDAPRRYLLVATGTGVAPFRAMLPQLRLWLRREAGQVVLLCGAGSREGLLYRQEFRALAQELPAFCYRGCLSREAPPPEEPDLLAGRVQSALVACRPDARDLALLCGNPAMVDDCSQRLQQAGLSPRSIRRERYVAAG